jgi:hypothetical protein
MRRKAREKEKRPGEGDGRQDHQRMRSGRKVPVEGRRKVATTAVVTEININTTEKKISGSGQSISVTPGSR